MLYESQEMRMRMEVGKQQPFERKSRRTTSRRSTITIVEEVDEEEERLEIVDLSGMSMESLPVNPSINLGAICKLDLSKNNLQVSLKILFTCVWCCENDFLKIFSLRYFF